MFYCSLLLVSKVGFQSLKTSQTQKMADSIRINLFPIEECKADDLSVCGKIVHSANSIKTLNIFKNEK